MTWSYLDIRTAYKRGDTGQYSHMIVALDTFDRENYPIYVPVGEDPHKHRPTNGDSVDECYRYSLGWSSQSQERRAQHWDWT